MTIRDFLCGLGLTLFVTAFILFLLPGAARPYDAVMGIVLASLNALFAGLINCRTIGLEQKSFMIWNVGGHGCRAGLLLLAIVFSSYGGVGDVTSFAVVTIAGYFSFLVFEIIALNRQSSRTVSET